MEILNISEIKHKFPKLEKIKWRDSEKFEYKLLDRENISDLEPFFDVITKNLSNSQTYVRNSYRENLDIFDRGGIFIGVFLSGEIAGIIIVDMPYTEQSLPSFMNLDKKHMEKSVIFDTICVLPKHRGYNLQEKLMCIAEYICLEKGYKYGFMSISPYNFYSLNNAFKQDFTIFAIEELYGSETKAPVERYILYLPFGKVLAEVEEQYSVANSNIKTQKEVIELGFTGMKAINFKNIDNFFVSYSKAFYD